MALSAAGLDFRRAASDDLPFLSALYHDFRADELAGTGWPEDVTRAFLGQQFALQHRHYLSTHPDADFLIITLTRPPQCPVDIGKLCLDRTGPRWRLIDIGLSRPWRANGLGRCVLKEIQERAVRDGAEAIDLSVAVDNSRAEALYTRLGFRRQGISVGSHHSMTWRVS